MARTRPSLFVGSSSEGLNIAKALQVLLDHARSRKVELDIISSQFGPLIAPDKLRQMNRDLSDLEETLRRDDSSAR